MKKFIAEYIKIIAYATLGLVFGMASFYLILNYQHSKEVAKPLYIGKGENTYLSFQEKLNQIDKNLESYKQKNVKNNTLNRMYSKLLTCNNLLNEEEGLSGITLDNYYNSYQIYKIGGHFQSRVLNVCWAVHLSYLTTENVPLEFSEVAPYISNTIDLASNQVSSAMDEIQNNSSYFYTTNITSATIRNYLSSDYQSIARAYDGFADIILNLSTIINEKAIGGDNE